MNRLLSLCFLLLCHFTSHAQITITAADMPVHGDTLRYSTAAVNTIISPHDSGLSSIWNYALTPITQQVDTYKTAIEVNPAYTTIPTTAYGYKVADTLPGLLPAYNAYTFFQHTTDSFIAREIAATIAGTPVAAGYTQPDVWYHFPLSYLRTDVDTFAVQVAIPGTGSITRTGYRSTRADGWGVLITPYSSAPAHCIRVRSQVHAQDSVTIGATCHAPLPYNTVEYKWLANGEHYPLLWVTATVTGTTETITSIRYRDVYRNMDTTAHTDTNVAVANVPPAQAAITAYPNPAVNGIVTLSVPMGWGDCHTELFDMLGKSVASFSNMRELDIHMLPTGTYLARITAGSHVAYVQILR